MVCRGCVPVRSGPSPAFTSRDTEPWLIARSGRVKNGRMAQTGPPIHDEVERIVFFSDAVFAIALTLLAVNLRLPSSHESVADLLRQMRPALFSFLVSFAVIGVTWMAHHRMFT